MSFYVLLPAIETAFCAGLLILLIRAGLRHVARKPFSVFLVCMGLWGFFIFMMRSSPNLEDALLWEQFVFIAILSAALFLYLFSLSLTGTTQRNRILYVAYALYLAFLALVPTGLVVSGIQMMWYGKAPIIGPLFFPYVSLTYLLIALALKVLIKGYRQSRDVDQRTRYSYVIAGIFVMLIGGTTDYLPPLGLNIYPLGIIGNILFCVLATVAMLRYGLLEVKIILRKGAAYSLVSMIVLGIFGTLVFLFTYVFREIVSPLSLSVTLITVFAAAAAFQPILFKIQQVVDRWFLRDRYDHLQALRRFTRETKDITELKHLSTSLVTTVAQGMQSRAVYLLLSDRKTNNFVLHSYYGHKAVKKLSLPADGPLALTMKQHNSIIDTDAMDTVPSLSVISDDDKQSLATNHIALLVPLKTKDWLIGMLLLTDKSPGDSYSTEDRQLLQKISNEVAMSIENALLYEKVQTEHKELQKTIHGILHALSLAVETRDPYTAGHQRRVTRLACAIARELGLPEPHMEGIRIAGLLHDIGKIAIPAEILSKPGRLSEYESSIIKTHPQVSYDILKEIEFPWPVAQVALQHHERMDGSGYPRGLTGKDIILEARILGVADVVEAMSSHRPYRPALGLESALNEISKHRSKLYDPKVVDACLTLFTKKGFSLEQDDRYKHQAVGVS